jgi:hypothetical protein
MSGPRAKKQAHGQNPLLQSAFYNGTPSPSTARAPLSASRIMLDEVNARSYAERYLDRYFSLKNLREDHFLLFEEVFAQGGMKLTPGQEQTFLAYDFSVRAWEVALNIASKLKSLVALRESYISHRDAPSVTAVIIAVINKALYALSPTFLLNQIDNLPLLTTSGNHYYISSMIEALTPLSNFYRQETQIPNLTHERWGLLRQSYVDACTPIKKKLQELSENLRIAGIAIPSIENQISAFNASADQACGNVQEEQAEATFEAYEPINRKNQAQGQLLQQQTPFTSKRNRPVDAQRSAGGVSKTAVKRTVGVGQNAVAVISVQFSSEDKKQWLRRLQQSNQPGYDSYRFMAILLATHTAISPGERVTVINRMELLKIEELAQLKLVETAASAEKVTGDLLGVLGFIDEKLQSEPNNTALKAMKLPIHAAITEIANGKKSLKIILAELNLHPSIALSLVERSFTIMRVLGKVNDSKPHSASFRPQRMQGRNLPAWTVLADECVQLRKEIVRRKEERAEWRPDLALLHKLEKRTTEKQGGWVPSCFYNNQVLTDRKNAFDTARADLGKASNSPTAVFAGLVENSVMRSPVNRLACSSSSTTASELNAAKVAAEGFAAALAPQTP